MAELSFLGVDDAGDERDETTSVAASLLLHDIPAVNAVWKVETSRARIFCLPSSHKGRLHLGSTLEFL